MKGTFSIPDMAKILPPGRCGVAELTHYTVSLLESQLSAFRPGQFCPPGTYALLKVGGATMMSDTRMERITNLEVIRRAKGDVLVAGFGIGMILVPLLLKPEVRSVTVVEKYGDVVALVRPPIEAFVGQPALQKLTVHVADIFTWRPARKGRQFDTVYFDIWSNCPNEDNAKEMTRLRRAFASYLRKGGWAASWRQKDVRRSR